MSKNKLEHIAFILDGNKRWSKKNKVSIKTGYKKGFEKINSLLENCLDTNIKYITLFTLSSENIKRKTVSSIFQIIYEDFESFFKNIINEKLIKINIIGSKNNLSDKIINLIKRCEQKTKNNKRLQLNLAFNYGFKDEIKYVLNKVLSNKNLDINDDLQIKNLFLLGSTPDPDLLIRTGGNKRLSNFIMYNLTYTEIYFIDTLWPDFSNKELFNIIKDFKDTTRSYGL